jgi:Fe-S oxidoreductase
MGEYADYRLNGDDCENCGVPFHDAGDGVPRQCNTCQADDPVPPKRSARPRTVPCPACTRQFHNHFALMQHRAAKAH